MKMEDRKLILKKKTPQMKIQNKNKNKNKTKK